MNKPAPWSEAQQAEMLRLFEAGVTVREIGRHLGVTANTISGKLWRQGIGKPQPQTTMDRLAVLNAKMDEVLR